MLSDDTHKKMGGKIGGKLSDYERLRLEKIRRNKAILDSLFPDLAESKEKLRSSLALKRKERRRRLSSPYSLPSREKGPVVVRRNPDRKARTSLTPAHCPPGAKVNQKSEESCSLEEDYFGFESKIRVYRGYITDPVDIQLDSNHETEEEREERIRLQSKPAHHVWEKKYDRTNGTTCHQCRQKTLDGKTRCNNKNCVGVRGQFCGVCLLNRYGEDAQTAIADKTWVCPPCKGFCNCSVCLSKRGKAPTGILTPIVRERGFNSVKDYLASLKGDEESEEDDDATMETSPKNRNPQSEMDYDDENKENIDPNENVFEEKENVPTKNVDGIVKKRKGIPLMPRIVLRDARSTFHENDEDGEVDKLRRSTEKLNISNPDNIQGEDSLMTSPPTSKRARAVTRCRIVWQSSKYSGGHQWVAPENIVGLDRGVRPSVGRKVEVRWGKRNKLYPAILSKVEYGVKRRGSCRF